MAQLYSDEGYPRPVVERLRDLGHDVLRIQDDHRANRGLDDLDVFLRAISLGRAVLTEDRSDYRRLHRLEPNHAGIVIVTTDSDIRTSPVD